MKAMSIRHLTLNRLPPYRTAAGRSIMFIQEPANPVIHELPAVFIGALKVLFRLPFVCFLVVFFFFSSSSSSFFFFFFFFSVVPEHNYDGFFSRSRTLDER